MALFDWISPDHDLRLDGEGVRLRPHRAADFTEWAELRAGSRDFLQPWEPTWPPDDLTRAAYRRRLSAYAADIERGVAYPFLVFRERDGVMEASPCPTSAVASPRWDRSATGSGSRSRGADTRSPPYPR
jgi:ribosomal-protein-alanine N-acetyltransferase